jgi:hypothetical protein
LGGLNELPQEETSGLGLGVTFLLLAAVVVAIFTKSVPPISPVGIAAWIAFLFFMVKMGSEAAPRLLLPYYPLAAVPILLLPVQDGLLRLRAWKILMLLAALSVVPALVFSPCRPLFPAVKISEALARQHPGNAAAQRFAVVYAAYAQRHDPLAALRAGLPDDAMTVGFVGGNNETDYSLWQPIGKRHVVYLQREIRDSAAFPAGIEWLVVNQMSWPQFSSLPLETWAEQHHAKIVLSTPVVMLVSWGPQTWCLLHVEK